MRTSLALIGRLRQTPPARRVQLLKAFERSGSSAAAFARQYGLTYTTFCGWRQQRAKARRRLALSGQAAPSPVVPKASRRPARLESRRPARAKASPAFVQVEMPAAASQCELVIALGGQARVRINSIGQVGLAARLLRELNPSQPC